MLIVRTNAPGDTHFHPLRCVYRRIVCLHLSFTTHGETFTRRGSARIRAQARQYYLFLFPRRACFICPRIYYTLVHEYSCTCTCFFFFFFYFLNSFAGIWIYAASIVPLGRRSPLKKTDPRNCLRCFEGSFDACHRLNYISSGSLIVSLNFFFKVFL